LFDISRRERIEQIGLWVKDGQAWAGPGRLLPSKELEDKLVTAAQHDRMNNRRLADTASVNTHLHTCVSEHIG